MSTAIRTPDQRLRVFVSSTIAELAPERAAIKQAIEQLRLTPVLFEMGARPHPPRELYHAYLNQSDIFIGIYWQSYGWIAPDETISGLEDEYMLSTGKPRLIYLKEPAPDRQERLSGLLRRLRDEDSVSYQKFSTPEQLADLVTTDLAILLTERFEQSSREAPPRPAPAARVPAMPVMRGPLIGRGPELLRLTSLLQQPDIALATLTGPGGSGKTRLALAAVTEVRDAFPDGVAFVPLAPIRDPALVPAAIAQALGLRSNGAQPIEEAVTGYCRPRRLLLVLDNMEQVVGAAPFLAGLLEAAPRLVLLVTSRVALRLRGEHEFPVPPLSLVRDSDGHSPAEDLFLLRAREVRPDLPLTPKTRGAVAELATRLDGLPLALELAAARVRVLPPADLLVRMTNRLDLLGRGPRDLPERQRTLRAAIGWSASLLAPEARTLLRRLSVFRGGWTLEVAEEVCGGDGIDVLSGLDTLLENSLIGRDTTGTRYTMLETIREYAREELAASGDRDRLQRRHAAAGLKIAEAHWAGAFSPKRIDSLVALAADRDNLRAALEWATANDPELGARLLGMLAWYWYFTANGREGVYWSDGLLPHVGRLSPESRGWLYWCAGLSHRIIANWPRSVDFLSRSVESFEEGGQRLVAGLVLALWGQTSLAMNDSAALDRLEGAVARFTGPEDAWMRALALSYLGEARLAYGDRAQAAVAFREAVAQARSLNDPWVIAVTLVAFAEFAMLDGRLPEARAAAEEAVAAFSVGGDPAGRTSALVTLGEVLLRTGEWQQARVDLLEAAKGARALRRADIVVRGLAGFARLALESGDGARAAQLGALGTVLMQRLPGALYPSGTALANQHLAVIQRADQETWDRHVATMSSVPAEELFQQVMTAAEEASAATV